MELKARILHANGSVTVQPIVLAIESAKFVSDVIIPACTKLREEDPTVACVKIDVPGFEKPYKWMGHYTSEHMAAVVAHERAGTENW